MRLSILIPSLPEPMWEKYLSELTACIEKQISELDGVAEICIDNRDRKTTTGEKRNDLLMKATGEYVWFVDADDEISPYAIEAILDRADKAPDVIGINGFMTTNGINRIDWEIRLGHPYRAVNKNGAEYYLRFPNHITPMRREHAIKIKFPHVSYGEDYTWAKELNESGILKTQEVIDTAIYHYRYKTKK